MRSILFAVVMLAGCVVDLAPPPARPVAPPPKVDSLAAAQAQDIYERQQWDAAQKVAKWEAAAKRLREEREAEERRLTVEREVQAVKDKAASLRALRKQEADDKAEAAAEIERFWSAPAKRYDAATLTRKFLSNQVAAAAELGENTIEVSGPVAGVDEITTGIAGHAHRHFVSCNFAEGIETKEIARLARGRRATLRGVYSEYRVHDEDTRWQRWVVLTRCRVKR